MSRSVSHRLLFDEVASFTRKLRALFDARLRQRGMTLPRTRALFAISRRDGLNQRELAEELELETPTVVRLLDSMEAQDVIERRADEADRRAKLVHLTPGGRMLADDIESMAAALRQQVLGNISEAELEVTLRVVRQMNARLKEMRAVEDEQ
ncbi:MAG: MarR family transcriptional regulator [Rhizobium sp. 63-7]|uniref:MarR family winged helix-turn-helix transcriptional regulator n=1 Tax=Rhizobium sp. YJ-22 TaxID=3037556 RepID=UPI000927BCAB|nr:MarR family winged helix-turn-helix transcriptional regulator [Rhizobium sp. YJ-22]MBN9028220.1 winged helix-turn-helix transcriptional regulator [Hyphomicrobiales bacterium]MDG3577281.1 MarR family winged helix-turn-helix transcriptional regulator [Rhizobium sp. YJ-22]OJU00701.1 MAG: MarR family transcriptional regulator [Rhizobium sp. 63-7]